MERRKLEFLLLIVVASATTANAHGGPGHCGNGNFYQVAPKPRWRIWSHPTIPSMAPFTHWPLEAATEQANRLIQLFNDHVQLPQALSNHQDGDDAETSARGVSEEVTGQFEAFNRCKENTEDTIPTSTHDTERSIGDPPTQKHFENDKPTRNNRGIDLKYVTNLWDEWLKKAENMDVWDWDNDNWPFASGSMGDDRGRTEHENQNEQYHSELSDDHYNELLRRKRDMERRLTEDRHRIHQLEQEIHKEKVAQKHREEQRRQEQQREEQEKEEQRRQQELQAQRRRQEEEQRKRKEKEIKEREQLMNEQYELERQIKQEQQRLRQLHEEQQMLRHQRLADEQVKRSDKLRSHPHQGQSPHRVNQKTFKRSSQPNQLNQQNPTQQQIRRSELFNLDIPREYTPRDIKVMTVGPADVKVIGKRICGCDENCVVKEFVRGFKLPDGVPSASLKVNFYDNGHLSIEGATNQREALVMDSEVPVVPRGDFEDVTAIRERLECLKRKTGFKLSKMDKKTGKTIEAEETRDFSRQKANDRYQRPVSDYEDDGVTIEVVEE